MNAKQKKVQKSKAQRKKLELRNKLWSNLDENLLWNRLSKDGYSTIPRTLPLICVILDKLSDKGHPIGSTYFALWGRVWDDSFIEIKNNNELAYESGFSGQRATTAWKNRMKKLEELGFISSKPGINGDFNYVLVYNPYLIIKDLKNKIQPELYIALYSRCQEINATDLD